MTDRPDPGPPFSPCLWGWEAVVLAVSIVGMALLVEYFDVTAARITAGVTMGIVLTVAAVQALRRYGRWTARDRAVLGALSLPIPFFLLSAVPGLKWLTIVAVLATGAWIYVHTLPARPRR